MFAAARHHGKALDLADVHARRAIELGIPVAIDTDTHTLSDLDHLGLGIGAARRAWIEPAHVLNTRSTEGLLAWTRRG